jgi:amino acid adenylation domain-containing protein
VPEPRFRDFVEQVLTAARRNPEATAVAGPDGRLTYAELDGLSGWVAQALAGDGVRRGAVVGVCLGQDQRLPAVLLGAARAGAAYLPLDLEHPLDRLEYQVADSGTRVLVAAGAGLAVAAELAARAPGDVRVIDLAEVAPGDGSVPVTEPAAPDEIAYLIYTSGSTGRPKGVEVTRENLAVHLDAVAQVFPMTPHDVMTTVAGVSFDITHLGIWGPLTAGGVCVLLEKTGFADGHALAERLETAGVTILQATPTSLRTLLAAGWQGDDDLRVMSGGEAIDPALAREMQPIVGELWNFYGPTEATIWATAQRLRETDLDPVTIGRPLPHYRAYVLGEDGQPVPLGIVGDLWIAGRGVAKGYRGRPDLTEAAFAADSWHAGERRYRTGDRARWLTNGALEFLGRQDHQVKVRGYRVELGEIESHLRESPAVSDAVVAVVDQGADTHLAGYVVWRAAADEAGLRRFMTERLPEYMVPHRWMSLAALPVLPSGKVDRAALPAPAEPRREQPADEPFSMTEQFIAKAWSEVLRVPSVRRGDNFFTLGGHSFAATLMVGRLRPVFGRVPVRVLFDHPVLGDFAAAVEHVALAQLAGENPAVAGDRG